MDRRQNIDRRSGQDRRQQEQGPPTSYERRRSIEPRQPELTELELSDEELKALGFIPASPDQPSPPK
ncbi:hypothetical protein [Acidovorax sp. JHL-9]|uniref:hypothetical protein n=1 Tax=Acidovorax sp. JHL-9 TaxID=1276756 RepID=UPI0004076D99|nr:hypothetical protein [Acidovorax sp. JHL-9]